MIRVDTSKTFQTIRGLGVTLPVTVNSKVYTRPFIESLVKDLGCSIIRTIFPTQESAIPDQGRLGAQLADLRRLKEINPDLKIIASVSSPPGVMKDSGGRLRPDARGAFVEYLSNLCKTFQEGGCTIYGMGFQNEAGRSYDVESYRQISNMLVDLRKTVKLLGTEDGFYALPSMKDAVSVTDILAVQGYVDTSWGTLAGFRAHATLDDIFNAVYLNFREQFGSLGKEAWVVEAGFESLSWKSEPINYDRIVTVRDADFFGRIPTAALDLALTINRAFTLGNFSAYVYGVASSVSFGEAGEYNPERALCENGSKKAKFQAAKHFFRYVIPGMVRVGADSDGVEVSAFKSERITVVVLINAKDFIVEDQIEFTGSVFNRFTSYASVENEYHHQESGDIVGNSVKLMILPNSILTIVVEG